MSMSGSELRERREWQGLSQQHLADIIGVNLKTISRWETNGAKIPRASEMALWHVFKMSPTLTYWDKRRHEIAVFVPINHYQETEEE